MSVYVDDILLASNIMGALETLKKLLAKEYEMKDLGEVQTIISWQITRNTAARTMKIDQSAFIRDLVIEEKLTECNANIIPMKIGLAIEIIEPNNYEKTDLREYQRLISKLIYLACGMRPNIPFVIGQLSKHNADPRRKHPRATKRVIRYLKGTM